MQGSSGFYPAEVLRRDGASAFPAGTHVYLDHPSETEEIDRPERSVRDLAGFLVDEARFESGPDGTGLFARIQFIEDVKDRIKSLAEHVGLSIRAAGDVEESATGRIVRSITQGLSVDVVTRAGAGGRLVTMTESSKPEAPPADKEEVVKESATDAVATTGTGALASEVASMKETFSDRVEQLSVEVARVTHQFKEAQRRAEKQAEELKEMASAIGFIKDRQEAADHKLGEAQSINQVVGALIEAKLPVPSLIRLAQGYHPGQDLHEAIQRERDYLKKVLRESERDGLNRESSGLGLTESAGTVDFTSASSSSPEDFAEIEDILSGKMY